MAIQRVRPQFVATNIITGEDRTDRVVLEAKWVIHLSQVGWGCACGRP